jgi:hypothetical protein
LRRAEVTELAIPRESTCPAAGFVTPPLGDRDTAGRVLDRRFRASTIMSCAGMNGTDGRRYLDHRAVAWPEGAVISSLPARALPQLVHSISDIGVEVALTQSLAERRPTARSERSPSS